MATRLGRVQTLRAVTGWGRDAELFAYDGTRTFCINHSAG